MGGIFAWYDLHNGSKANVILFYVLKTRCVWILFVSSSPEKDLILGI